MSARAAEALRLGPRGRGPERRRGSLRARACPGSLRRDAQGKRNRAAPRRDHAPRAARHRARIAPMLHQRPLRPRRAHVTASPIRISRAALRATTRTRPTSSPIRATRRKSPRYSTGPAAPTRRSRRSAADRACAAASSRIAARHKGAVTIDLRDMGKVKEVDKISRAALIEGGTYGPALEAQLRPHGLTLRHFPQSFEYSTLGGWIATRSGGHFATLYTHIDDLVESLRMVTPKGVLESRRLPGSGAGPSPDRMMIGSEGILGIITQAWMRLQDRPTFRAGGAVRFGLLHRGARGARGRAGRALSVELPHPRSGGGAQHRRGGWLGRHHGARLRVGRSRRDAVDGACARMLRRPWRRAGGERRRRRIARAPPASGATPSSACPTRWSG